MDHALQQRLLGAALLVFLAVVFVPMGFDGAGYKTRLLQPTNSRLAPFEATGAQRAGGEFAPPTARPPGHNNVSDDDDAPHFTQSSSPAEARASRATAQSGGWFIQLGSFAQRDNAATLRNGLRQQGYQVVINSEREHGKRMHKVLVGPEPDRQAAERLQTRLDQQAGYAGGFVREFQP